MAGAPMKDSIRRKLEHLAERFSLEHEFIDIPNPV